MKNRLLTVLLALFLCLSMLLLTACGGGGNEGGSGNGGEGSGEQGGGEGGNQGGSGNGGEGSGEQGGNEGGSDNEGGNQGGSDNEGGEPQLKPGYHLSLGSVEIATDFTTELSFSEYLNSLGLHVLYVKADGSSEIIHIGQTQPEGNVDFSTPGSYDVKFVYTTDDGEKHELDFTFVIVAGSGGNQGGSGNEGGNQGGNEGGSDNEGGNQGGSGNEGGNQGGSSNDKPITSETYKFIDETGIFTSVKVNEDMSSAMLYMLVGDEPFEVTAKLYEANGCYILDVDVPLFAVVFNNESKTASFYESDSRTGLKYHYNPSDDTDMNFDIYGKYEGAGNYFCLYTATVDGINVQCAIQVYLDLENNVLSAGEYAEFNISADGYTLTTGNGDDEKPEDKETVSKEEKNEILIDFNEEIAEIVGNLVIPDDFNQKYEELVSWLSKLEYEYEFEKWLSSAVMYLDDLRAYVQSQGGDSVIGKTYYFGEYEFISYVDGLSHFTVSDGGNAIIFSKYGDSFSASCEVYEDYIVLIFDSEPLLFAYTDDGYAYTYIPDEEAFFTVYDSHEIDSNSTYYYYYDFYGDYTKAGVYIIAYSVYDCPRDKAIKDNLIATLTYWGIVDMENSRFNCQGEIASFDENGNLIYDDNSGEEKSKVYYCSDALKELTKIAYIEFASDGTCTFYSEGGEDSQTVNYIVKGDFYEFDLMGVLTLAIKCYDDGTADWYKPEGECFWTISSYPVTFSFYGKYTGPDNYVTVMNSPSAFGEVGEEYTDFVEMSIVVYLNLEESYFIYAGQTLYFDENGIITGDNAEDETVTEELKNEIKDSFDEEIHYILNGNQIPEELDAKYNELIYSLYELGYYSEVDAWISMADEFLEELRQYVENLGGNGDNENAEEELQALIADTLAKMEADWKNAADTYGEEFANRFYEGYESYCDLIRSATVEENYVGYHYYLFTNWLSSCIEKFENNDKTIQYATTVGNVDINAPVGTTFEEVLELIYESLQVELTLTNGEIVYDTLRGATVEYSNFPEVLENVGEYYYVELCYVNGDYSTWFYIYVDVIPADDDAELLYRLENAESDWQFEILVIELYDNGYAMIYDDYDDSYSGEYFFYKDNVIGVSIYGVPVYFEIDESGEYFYDYIPSEGTFIELEVYDENIFIKFYGEYDGAGEYLAAYCVTYWGEDENGEYTEYIDCSTVTMYIDMESRFVRFDGFGELYYDDNNIASEALDDEYRSYYVDDMTEDWNELAYYYDVSDYQEAFDELISAIYDAKTLYEADVIYEQLNALIDEVRGSYGVDTYAYLESLHKIYYSYVEEIRNACAELFEEYQSLVYCATSNEQAKLYVAQFEAKMKEAASSFKPGEGGESGEDEDIYIDEVKINSYGAITVPIGTTIDELAEIICRNYFIAIYYSNGSIERVEVTFDMIDFDDIPEVISEEGKYSYSIGYGWEYSHRNFYLTIIAEDAAVDMEGASFIEAYKLAENEYFFGIYAFELYDNGYAYMYVYGQDRQITSYFFDDGALAVEFNSAYGYMCIDGLYTYFSVNENDGTFAPYVPKEPIIGEYIYDEDEDDVYVSIYGDRNAIGDCFAVCSVMLTVEIEGCAKEYLCCFTLRMYYDPFESTADIGNNSYYIDEDGYFIRMLTDETREEMLANLEQRWNELSAKYDVSAYTDNYLRYYSSIQNSTSYWDADEDYGRILAILNNIPNNAPSLDGGDNSELESHREYVLAAIIETCEKYAELYGEKFVYAYGEKLSEYLTKIENAETIDEIDYCATIVTEILNEADKKLSESGIYVSSTYIPNNGIYVYEGTSVDEVVAAIVDNCYVIVEFSNGHTVTVYLSSDMVWSDDIDTSETGSFDIYVNFSYDDGDYFADGGAVIHVYVQPDMDKATLIGSYSMQGESISLVELYDNGYAKLYIPYDEECVIGEYALYDDLCVITVDGVDILIVLSNDETAGYYIPEGESFITLKITPMAFAFYGEYTGAGKYVTIYSVTGASDEYGNPVNFNMSVLAYIDMENRTFSFGNMTFSFDEHGNVTGYGPGNDSEDDGEGGNQGGTTYPDYPEYEGTTVYVPKAIYYVTANSTIEEIINVIVENCYAIIYYSSGKEVTVNITEEMIRMEDIYDIDTSELGSFEVYIDLPDEFYISVTIIVSPELSEEDIIGTYYYEGENFLGISEITLYSNGYAILSTYEDPAIVEYVKCDEYYAFNIDGVYVIMVLNEDGTATNYVPEEDCFITLYDDYATIKVHGNYEGAGDYVALYVMSLPLGDGSIIEGCLSVIIYIDLENNYAEFAEQGMYFDEDGVVYYYGSHPDDGGSGSDSDLQYEIKNLIIWAQDEFKSAHDELGSDFYNAYYDNYSRLLECIYNSSSIDEAYAFFEKIMSMIEEGRNKFSDNTQTYMYTEFNFSYWEVEEGSDFTSFLQRFLEEAYVSAYYSNGDIETYYFNLDDIYFPMDPPVTFVYGEQFYFYADYSFTNVSGDCRITVEVLKNMDNAGLIGSYVINRVDNLFSIQGFDLYDNGVMILYGPGGASVQVAYEDLGGFVKFNTRMFDVVMFYDDETGTCGYIELTDGLEVIETVYPEDDQVLYIIGPYDGVGSYVTVWTISGMGSLSVIVTYDQEASTFELAGGKFLIYGDGTIVELATEEDIADAIDSLTARWNEVSASCSNIEDYVAEYNEIMDRIRNAYTSDELSDARNEGSELCNRIISNGSGIGGSMNGGAAVVLPTNHSGSDDGNGGDYSLSYKEYNGVSGNGEDSTVIIDGVEYTYATLTPAA